MAQPHAESNQVVNLLADWPASTTAVLKAESLEVIRLALPAGTRMPRHAAPGELTLFGVSGCMSLVLDDRSLSIGPGDFVHLKAGEPHAVEAHEDARVLLTLSLRPAESAGAAVETSR